jgi:spore germination cell wall hydrolase CwlJ-like protein
MKTKIHQNPTVVKWSSRVLNAIGLCLVIAAVFAVSNSKLSQLRQDNRALPAGYVSAAENIKQLDCLTRNIYWEAASEPFEGKVGVAQVTLNRVESGKFAPTVCGVVYQKNVFYEKVVCQFSWFCETTHKIKPVHAPLWKESEEVAKKVLLEGFRLPGLENALFYHADYVSPGWKLPRIEKIGRHIFYGDKA